jgi:hypothetical protein
MFVYIILKIKVSIIQINQHIPYLILKINLNCYFSFLLLLLSFFDSMMTIILKYMSNLNEMPKYSKFRLDKLALN